MSATVGAATSGSRPELIGVSYRRLRGMGFDEPEAANLTALKNGVGIVSQPWTVRELTHLLFLRERRFAGHRGCAGAPPAAARSPRTEPNPADGRVTLVTLLRSIAGPTATLDLLRPSTRSRLDAVSDSGREGG